MADFTSAANIKTALDITTTGDDARLAELVPQITALMELAMDRRGVFFKKGSADVYYPCLQEESDRLFLPRYPDVAITSIHVSLDLPRVYGADELLTANEDYLIEVDSGIVHRTGSRKWPVDPLAIQVVYDGGYTADAGGGPGGAKPFPAELERAAIMIAAAMLQKGKDRSYHITGHEIGDGEVRGIRFSDVPDTAQQILDMYRDTRQGVY